MFSQGERSDTRELGSLPVGVDACQLPDRAHEVHEFCLARAREPFLRDRLVTVAGQQRRGLAEYVVRNLRAGEVRATPKHQMVDQVLPYCRQFQLQYDAAADERVRQAPL